MLTERLQVLLTPEQKRRLETEAHARGESVGGLVREAIDECYGRRFSVAERMRAVQEILAMHSVPFLVPAELTQIQEQEIEQEYPELFPPRERR